MELERIIMVSSCKGVEVHVIGEDSINHFKEMSKDSNGEFRFSGVAMDVRDSWIEVKSEKDFLDHFYEDGSRICLNDTVTALVAKGIKRTGKVVFRQSAYGLLIHDSGVDRFTPFCCFAKTVVFSKTKVTCIG